MLTHTDGFVQNFKPVDLQGQDHCQGHYKLIGCIRTTVLASLLNMTQRELMLTYRRVDKQS